MTPTVIELEIDDLAFDGKSVGKLDGKVVFCNGGLPGERVLAEITRNKPRYCQAKVTKILRKSDLRIEARCDHFDICGGCTWQDLAYEQQLRYKKDQVVQCLSKLGKLPSVVVHDVIGSPDQFSYRNKMEFSFNTSDHGGFSLGLHERGRWDSIFDLGRCHLTSPVVNELVAWMREYVAANGLSVYDVATHEGYMRFLVVREGINTGRILVNVVTNYGEFPLADKLVHGLTTRFESVATIVHNQNGRKSNIAAGEIETVLYGPGYVEERLGRFVFRIRANSFFQTNTRQAERLYEIGFDMLQPTGSERLLDLYCGTGSIGILASERVQSVTGVELVPDAVEAARENAAANNVTNAVFFEGDVKDLLNRLNDDDTRYEAVIVDPPRAGLHPKALRGIVEMAPARLLYISCNPATFARDAALLVAAGWRLPEVRPVDMFPHTMHIELVGLFRRE
ncbi:MAG: 23S rRNA (uracil(1939)-C(5))-methyltransferase RlmD [candidate division Zixibacteria bacterium]|jgi:23S rRNA (uracil1939-C5)-methyltransferase|nr:23S rRNA (uracil(1939)-C(5))-methyltransferase RlmD [candidate division Zixibacteria bacterium]